MPLGQRLPRPRGDRPECILRQWGIYPAPPPTRGSTRRGSQGRPSQSGSPAHAGIDPVPRGFLVTGCRLPRPRGDRPGPNDGTTRLLLAPPPTRGSTRIESVQIHHIPGSPAHAGIDPMERPICGRATRLPRPRGDRPDGYDVVCDHSVAPPPTRGSTLEKTCDTAAIAGSPAHAGIDPISVSSSTENIGLPRPRGDRPCAATGATVVGSAPPPTRGSTARRHPAAHHRPGSPAHAGIDPPQGMETPRCRGLPRPRGDRPNVCMAVTNQAIGAPAYC
jgi:hypothetical protein